MVIEWSSGRRAWHSARLAPRGHLTVTQGRCGPRQARSG